VGQGTRSTAAVATAMLLIAAGVAACSAAGVHDAKTQGQAVAAATTGVRGASAAAVVRVPPSSSDGAAAASPGHLSLMPGAPASAASGRESGSAPTGSPYVSQGVVPSSAAPSIAPGHSPGVHLRPLPTPAQPATPAAAALLGASEITEADNGRTVQIAAGATLTLVLHGHGWTPPRSSDLSVLALAAAPSYSAAGPIACTAGSACGTVTTVFVAVANGEARITAGRTGCGDVLPCAGLGGPFAVTVRVGS